MQATTADEWGESRMGCNLQVLPASGTLRVMFSNAPKVQSARAPSFTKDVLTETLSTTRWACTQAFEHNRKRQHDAHLF